MEVPSSHHSVEGEGGGKSWYCDSLPWWGWYGALHARHSLEEAAYLQKPESVIDLAREWPRQPGMQRGRS